MTFSTGFQSNLGIISAIVGLHDYVIMDRENHASLYEDVYKRQVHSSCDLLNVIATFNIFEEIVIVQLELRSENIRFVLHPVIGHIKDVKLFETCLLYTSRCV